LKTDVLKLREEDEGSESAELLSSLGGDNRQLYCSLLNNEHFQLTTPRLYHLTSLSGDFSWTELVPSYWNPAVINPYPFLQSDLYTASQPALFLLDTGRCLWLWQGWWDCEENERGSGLVRFQEERRAAMKTALAYWTLQHGETKPPKAYLVWAGLEPLDFTNLFPVWKDRDDIAEINIQVSD
jgi:supervillin